MSFNHFTDRHLVALYRCAKTRGRAFFRYPYHMIRLRQALEKRNLL